MIEVWITSIGKNFSYLNDAIKSCLKQTIPVIIRLSIYCPDDDIYAKILQLLPSSDRIHIYQQKKLKKQFDQIAWLENNIKTDSQEWIIFLDDDDILFENLAEILQNEKSKECFIGLQYIGAHKDTSLMLEGADKVTYESVKEYIEQNKNIILIADDFSGTSAKRYIVSEYFLNRKESITEDCMFMEYLEDFQTLGHYEYPIAYHRIKNEKSEWVTDMKKEFLTLIGEFIFEYKKFL